jgi:hypothetical protein
VEKTIQAKHKEDQAKENSRDQCGDSHSLSFRHCKEDFSRECGSLALAVHSHSKSWPEAHNRGLTKCGATRLTQDRRKTQALAEIIFLYWPHLNTAHRLDVVSIFGHLSGRK